MYTLFLHHYSFDFFEKNGITQDTTDGDQIRPPQNRPLWHEDYVELKTTEK